MPEVHDWPEPDLVRRLVRALSIAGRALDALGESGYDSAAAPEDSFGPDKPLAETAMLLHAAATAAAHPEIRQHIDALLGKLERLTHTDRIAAAIALYPSIAWQLAMPHVLLRPLGLADDRLDALLEASSTATAGEGREVLPHRRLERLWLGALWLGQGPPAPTDLAEPVAASVLAHPVDLLMGARDDAYALTHGLMYVTDFGSWPATLPRTREDVLGEASALLARALVAEDYDLAAELLMAWPLTGAAWSPAAGFGFRVLAEFEDEVGYLPAGNGVPARYRDLAGEERTKYALAASYHTAYVWGIVCALALRAGTELPTLPVGRRHDSATIDALRAVIPDADTPWQRSYARLEPAERAALGPFLVDAALASAMRRSDFPAVARILELAAGSGLANSPACGQAAELLGRLAGAAQPVAALR